jgi:Glyoxalase-like domain
VTDRKTSSNRLHIDIHASGERALPIEVRKERVDAEALRLRDLGATLLSDLSEELEEGIDHYAVALKDPEGNEFDIN